MRRLPTFDGEGAVSQGPGVQSLEFPPLSQAALLIPVGSHDTGVAQFLILTEVRTAQSISCGGGPYAEAERRDKALPRCQPDSIDSSLPSRGPTGTENAARHRGASGGSGGTQGCGTSGQAPTTVGVLRGSSSDPGGGTQPAIVAYVWQKMNSVNLCILWGRLLDSEDKSMTTQELILLTKFFQAVGELSKLEHQGLADKPEDPHVWKNSVRTILTTTRQLEVNYWWNVLQTAEEPCSAWLDTHLMEGSQVKCTSTLPTRCEEAVSRLSVGRKFSRRQ